MSDIDTAAEDSLKVLDPNRPIREADMQQKQRTDYIMSGGAGRMLAPRYHHSMARGRHPLARRSLPELDDPEGVLAPFEIRTDNAANLLDRRS